MVAPLITTVAKSGSAIKFGEIVHLPNLSGPVLQSLVHP